VTDASAWKLEAHWAPLRGRGGNPLQDIECVFGRLKTRFDLLDGTLLFGKVETVDDIFWVCCILHNMCLRHDGLDSLGYDGERDWLVVKPPREHADLLVRVASHLPLQSAHASIPIQPPVPPQVYAEVEHPELHAPGASQFERRRAALATHYLYEQRQGRVGWKKTQPMMEHPEDGRPLVVCTPATPCAACVYV
jgi:hypothetical protein